MCQMESKPDELTMAYGDWAIPELVKKLADKNISFVLEAKVRSRSKRASGPGHRRREGLSCTCYLLHSLEEEQHNASPIYRRHSTNIQSKVVCVAQDAYSSIAVFQVAIIAFF